MRPCLDVLALGQILVDGRHTGAAEDLPKGVLIAVAFGEVTSVLLTKVADLCLGRRLGIEVRGLSGHSGFSRRWLRYKVRGCCRAQRGCGAPCSVSYLTLSLSRSDACGNSGA